MEWKILEDGDSISLQSREHILFSAQFHEDNVSLLDKYQTGLLAAHYKSFRFLNLELATMKKTHPVHGTHMAVLHITCGLWSMESWCELEAHTDSYAQIMMPFVSDPGILCLLLSFTQP